MTWEEFFKELEELNPFLKNKKIDWTGIEKRYPPPSPSRDIRSILTPILPPPSRDIRSILTPFEKPKKKPYPFVGK